MLANISIFLRAVIPVCVLLMPGLALAQASNKPNYGDHPNPEEVRKVVEDHRGKIQGCFKKHSQSLPERLDVQFTIWKDGGVNWASIDSDIADPSVTRCVRDVILLMNFPPPKVEIAKISYPFFFRKPRTGLSQGSVYNVITGGANDVEQCYRRALTSNPGLARELRVEFVIGTDGTVNSEKIVDSTLNNAQVEDCILGVFSKMKFPAPKGGEVMVTFPFVFSSNFDEKHESSKVEPKETRYSLAVIADHAGAINQCYSEVNDPSNHPGVRVRFVIGKSGIPEALSTPMSNSPTLTRCVIDVVRTMRFRPANREVMMNYPFKFIGEAKEAGESGSVDKDRFRDEIRANRDLCLYNQNLERCVHEALFELSFPKVPGIVIVNYPFNFST